MRNKLMIGIVAGLLLAGCGSSNEDRAASGAMIGAGAGAVGSAIFSGSALAGGVVGAVVGGVAGTVTDESQVDLGKPLWRRGE